MTVALKEIAPVATPTEAAVGCDTVRGVANMLLAAYRAGKQLPEVAFSQLSSTELQEALLEFAISAGLSALDERVLVVTHCVNMAKEFRDFISYTLLSRHKLKADLPFLKDVFILSFISREQLFTTPESVISRADDFFVACLRVKEAYGHPQLAWTLAPPNAEKGDLGAGLTRDYVRMRDLWLTPGLTPLRKLARDRKKVPVREITIELMNKWRETASASARIRQRNKIGLNTDKFHEAWRRRVDLENPFEMQAAITALRALRAGAALTRAMHELSSIALRCELVPGALLNSAAAAPKGVAARVEELRSLIRRCQRAIRDCDAMRMPALYVRYPDQYVPRPVADLVVPDPALAGYSALPASAIASRPDREMLLTGHSMLMADMREVIRHTGMWHGPFARDLEAASFNVETGLWELLFEGDNPEQPETMTHEQFQCCRWYTVPQMVRVGHHQLRDGDCAFAIDGVVFNLDWWQPHANSRV